MQEQQKQLIKTMRIGGAPYSRIAGQVGLSINTVKSFCRRSHIQCRPFRQNHTPVPAETMQGMPRCKNCGIVLPLPRGRQKRFCSDRCRYIWWNENRRQKAYPCTCQYCGRKFTSFGNRARKYCSRECANAARNQQGVP